MYKWIRMRLVWKPEGKIDDVALVLVWIILITSARDTDVVVLDGLEMLMPIVFWVELLI